MVGSAEDFFVGFFRARGDGDADADGDERALGVGLGGGVRHARALVDERGGAVDVAGDARDGFARAVLEEDDEVDVQRREPRHDRGALRRRHPAPV